MALGSEPEAHLKGAPPRARLTEIERAIGAAAMAAICVISFANVVVRYATNVSFAFTEEFSVALLVVMAFAGAGLAFARDGHIRVGYMADRLPRRWRRAASAFAGLASLFMLGLIAWYGGWLAYDEWRFEETSPGLGYPSWIYTILMPLLAVLVMVRIIGALARAWRAHA